MTTVHAAAPIAPPHLLSLASHLGLAMAVAILVALCWNYAEDASRHAVDALTATHVTLPPVQVVGRRGHASLLAVARASA